MPPPIALGSLSLNESLTRLRNHVFMGPAEDWCVLRFDRDDSTLEVYWSEPNAPYRTTSYAQNSPGGQFRGWG